MIIGHLPAGYVLTKKLQDRLKTKKFLLAGLIATVLPDIDVFYFYFIDNRQHLHHSYWIHIPFYWLLAGLIAFILIYLFKKRGYYALALIVFSNIFLHLFLDTIVGKIEWLYPFSGQSFSFFEVPAVYDWWVYNFVFHWTFLFEIGVIIWATILFFKNRKHPNAQK